VRRSSIACLVTGAALVGATLPAGAAQAAECLGQPSEHRLTVQITGVRQAKGLVAVTLYPDAPGRFLAPKGKLARARPNATAPVTTTCFWLPGPGAYAVAIYHDANADRDFNRTLVGLPAEGYGFSNDAPTKTGLPAFKQARFLATAKDTTIRIRMRYP
jgi:uncharacterized protein (DUF2141 family)